MSPNQPSVSSIQASADVSQLLAVVIAQAADDRKGGDIQILKVDEVSFLADYFVIVTGFSRTQVRAIATAMGHAAEEQCQRQPLRKEGQSEATWIVLDYGDVIAHILMPEQRDYYDLEAFWGHAERLNITLSTESSAGQTL
ncbi:Ribosomal silencing factor RsfS [Acaryochloris thomasi RCC1774]|uniref:Ribosomal silencing factor RsfS n=1 Tax=Acaryochloris thomasi RCC1774 TaxID=1764569 RepID=A0A2W1JNQ1_9CYAN|nr:ribosome silencing factor [Acaryochloris thomasi]PZD74856.1 Ribosomal silencing factor RsfS [Acaryochloris thomasi RCC1774]